MLNGYPVITQTKATQAVKAKSQEL